MPTIDQVKLFFDVVIRIVLEISFLAFSVFLLLGFLRRTWKWTFKNEDNEIELKVERRD